MSKWISSCRIESNRIAFNRNRIIIYFSSNARPLMPVLCMAQFIYYHHAVLNHFSINTVNGSISLLFFRRIFSQIPNCTVIYVRFNVIHISTDRHRVQFDGSLENGSRNLIAFFLLFCSID